MYQQNKVDISGNYFIPLTLCVPVLQSYVNCPDRVQKKRKKSQNVLITKTEADRAKLFILLQLNATSPNLINSSKKQHKVDSSGNYFIPLIKNYSELNCKVCLYRLHA